MTLSQLKDLVAMAEQRHGLEECEVSVDGHAVSAGVVLLSAPGLVLASSRTVAFHRVDERGPVNGQGYRAEAAALLASGGP